jgi:thioredoxin 1
MNLGITEIRGEPRGFAQLKKGGIKMATKLLATTEEFKQSIKNGVSLVDFNAPWCGPCRAQEPIIKQLSEQFTGKATIAEMNIDDNQETAVELGIQSIPTMAVFKNGKEIQRFVGLQSSNTLARALEDTINENI